MKRIIIMTLSAVFALSLVSTNAMAQKGKFQTSLEKVKDRIDPASIAGINTYETDIILKTLKVRKAARKNEVASLLDRYNSSLNGLKDNNLGLLVGLGTSVKDMIQNKDFNSVWNARSEYKENMKAVQEQQLVMQSNMEEQLMEVLNRRQRKKWNKYQAELRKEAEATFDMGDLFGLIGM